MGDSWNIRGLSEFWARGAGGKSDIDVARFIESACKAALEKAEAVVRSQCGHRDYERVCVACNAAKAIRALGAK